MILKEKIEEYIQEEFFGTEKFLVEVVIRKGDDISVFIDSMKGITIDECVSLTRFLESKLNRDEQDFELTVSSAGLTSPYKVIQQYQKNINKKADFILDDGEKIVATILSVSEDGVQVEYQEEAKENKKIILTTNNIFLNFKEIKQAKSHISF